jgi:hypothetical protein
VPQVCSGNYVLKFIQVCNQVLFSLYKFCSEVYTGSEVESVLKFIQVLILQSVYSFLEFQDSAYRSSST